MEASMTARWAAQNSFLFNEQEEMPLISACNEKERKLVEFDFEMRYN